MCNTTPNWPNIEVFRDEKEHVEKYVFTKESCVVESVLYKYPTYKERTVICCSTMSGCPNRYLSVGGSPS